MRLLLDTHLALWRVRNAPELTARARQLILVAGQVFVSSVSIWEVTVKSALGQLPDAALERLRPAQHSGLTHPGAMPPLAARQK